MNYDDDMVEKFHKMFDDSHNIDFSSIISPVPETGIGDNIESLLSSSNEQIHLLKEANAKLTDQISYLDHQLKVQQDSSVKLTAQYNQMKKEFDSTRKDSKQATILSVISIIIAIASLLIQLLT